MRRLTAMWLVMLGALVPAIPASAAEQPTTGANARYALAKGCFDLRSKANNRLVTKSPSGAYAASTTQAAAAEPIRMQATALGSYMLYGRAGDFLSTSGGQVRSSKTANEAGNWNLDIKGNAFTLTNHGRALATNGAGALVLASASNPGLFAFDKASNCAVFPEVSLSATGTPHKGSTSYTETSGYLDGHMHMMAFEFLGGKAHCGRPWSAYGAPTALTDCPDHYPNGAGGVLETALRGGTHPTHDPVGWPTFKDWPAPDSLTHEQAYYRWLERSWMGGQRIFVNLFVENKVLCEIYPYKKNSCDEMKSIRLQNKDIRQMENYIDAQAGGPGKGFFRIVTDPFQARKVINQGKLAVVLGVEVSEPFNCQTMNDQPKCDRAQIERLMSEMYGFGVRQMEIINKFDNALAGVAGDDGTTGAVVNNGNRLETGHYWNMQACTGPTDEHDRESPGVYDHDHNDAISNGLGALLPLGLTPIYPKGAQCNVRGLTELGDFAVRRLMDKKIIIDPDHLSVRSRKGLMDLLEARRYPGVISSHSWSSADVNPRIYKLGGVITPYAGSAKDFAVAWKSIRKLRPKNYYWGFGWGADMNGFGAQGDPRNGPNPVTYPFKSEDGKVTLDRGTSGVRKWDINKDGVANYGLYPDWVQDLRHIAGNQIVKDLNRGSEAYLQMWERTVGVPNQRCRSARGIFTSKGMGRHKIAVSAVSILKRAGQPNRRVGRLYKWCVAGKGNRGKRVAAVMTKSGKVGLIASNALGHGTISKKHKGKRVRISRGAFVKKLRGRAKKISKTLYVKRVSKGRKIVYGVRKGRVRYVALAAKSVGAKRSTLRRYIKLSGVR